VRYRWYGAEGVLQRTRLRRTPLCRQPDQRPDLEVDSVAVADGPEPGTYRYVLGVRNFGRGAAGPFQVGAAGLERDVVRPVAGVPAGDRTTVELVAPRCEEGEAVTFQVDVRDAVDETDEGDNRFRWRCVPPIPSSG
jgi:subtilase family serine protease